MTMKRCVLAVTMVSLLVGSMLLAGEPMQGPSAPEEKTLTTGAQAQPDEMAQAVKEVAEELSPGWLRERTVLDMANWQWVLTLVLLLVSVVVGRVVRFLLAAWLKRWLRKREEKNRPPLPDKAVTNAERPVGYLLNVLIIYAGLPALGLPQAVHVAITVAATIGIAVAGVWVSFRLADLVAVVCLQFAAKTESKLDDLLVPLIRRTLKVFITIFGVLFVGENLDMDVSGLLAGLGLGGLAFALAAKDTVANFFGSITILLDQPFRIGDWVVIGDAEGTVEDVGFRTTRIRTFYNSVICLPNSTIVNTQVDNLGMRVYRRCKCMISITYGTAPEKVEAFTEGVREIIRLHPYTRKDYFNVYFNAFAESSLDVLLYVFWKVPNWMTELREKQRLFVDIMRLAELLDVEFAFPTQTLHVASAPSETGIPSGKKLTALVDKAAGALAGKAAGVVARAPKLITGEDFDRAHELGRELARQIVHATLGDPVVVPPPATGR